MASFLIGGRNIADLGSESRHQTAVLVERDNGRAWAIDSWYRPNGSPAAVWPMELWRARKEDEGNRENRGSD